MVTRDQSVTHHGMCAFIQNGDRSQGPLGYGTDVIDRGNSVLSQSLHG